MEMFFAAKTTVDGEETVEISAFVLRSWVLPSGTKVEQHRESAIIATWELVSHTNKSVVLKKLDIPIEFGDMFYAESPVIEAPMVEAPTMNVFVFSGKNWKLASAKKWTPAELLATTVHRGMSEILGDINIKGKDCDVCKVTNKLDEIMFIAVPKAVPPTDNPVNIE